MTDQRTFVIVGASLAGAKAAEALRDEGFTGRIVLIGEETERPYERPPLSKGYLLGDDERSSAYVHDEQWYTEHNVELRLGVRVTDLDAAAKTVTLDGVDQVNYDKLLLATGSRVRTLDVPGADLRGTHYLRTLDEADSLLAKLADSGRVVVIGAGWIGLETAAAARSKGAEVTVVEMDSLPLRRVLGDEVAQVYANVHREHGVDFRFGASVERFEGEDGHLRRVVLKDGSELPADLAVIGVGIRPNTELAESAGLSVDNGVVTDASLRTSNPDIYACGDVMNAENPLLGKHIRVEHWDNAISSGQTAAKAMLDKDVTYDKVPYFFSDQYHSSPGTGMEYAGWVEPGGYDRVVFRGDPTVRADADPEFIAFWVKDDRVLAAMNVNIWDVQDDLQKLVRAGHRGKGVDVARLSNGDVPLSDLAG
jgi:3-phenylpropionate/trans-cinnamate dioxygenase ferredoxin reductase subunit